MTYYHLTVGPGKGSAEIRKDWYYSEGVQLKCPECREMLRLSTLPNIPLDEPPTGIIDFLFGLGLGIASVQLLEEFGWEDVNRYLILGRLLSPKGKVYERYFGFQGRHRTFFRGTGESTYRGLCSLCGAPRFHATGITKDRYLLSNRLPAAPISESQTTMLVVSEEYLNRLSSAMRRRLRPAPLPVIDEPRDGLGELPF